MSFHRRNSNKLIIWGLNISEQWKQFTNDRVLVLMNVSSSTSAASFHLDLKALARYTRNCKKCSNLLYTLQFFFHNCNNFFNIFLYEQQFSHRLFQKNLCSFVCSELGSLLLPLYAEDQITLVGFNWSKHSPNLWAPHSESQTLHCKWTNNMQHDPWVQCKNDLHLQPAD